MIETVGEEYDTNDLVADFMDALQEKLYHSHLKYGYGESWKDTDWKDKCKEDLLHHIEKGDPLDVAAYCAFMWYHGWSTNK